MRCFLSPRHFVKRHSAEWHSAKQSVNPTLTWTLTAQTTVTNYCNFDSQFWWVSFCWVPSCQMLQRRLFVKNNSSFSAAIIKKGTAVKGSFHKSSKYLRNAVLFWTFSILFQIAIAGDIDYMYCIDPLRISCF